MRASRASSGVLPDCIATLQWRGHIMCYINCYMAFCAAAVTDWSTAKSHIDKVEATAKDLDVPLVGPLGSVLVYLTGVYHQGTGDLDTALEIFQDKRFDLPSEAAKVNPRNSADQVERDIALLAALSSLWIQQDGHRKNPSRNTSLISILQPLCKNHPNKDIETAFNLVMATVETDPSAPLFQVKNCLRAALSGAQTTANTQFLCITLSVMCNRFFSNVVGAQAEKSAQAASVQAQKSGNILWRSVADGMLAQCYEVNGKASDASYTMDQAFKLAQMALPDF
jgi:Cohesin loading factor